MPSEPASPAASGVAAPGGCTVLVPVKGLDHAKSRLAPLGDARRRALAAAFAADTVATALATPGVDEVVVVADDPEVGGLAQGWGVTTSYDAGDLNAALLAAGRAARRRRPGVRLLALCADLPAVTVPELGALLASTEPVVVVADRHGTGTTALLSDGRWAPSFGVGSYAAHRAAGAAAFTSAVPGLRCDVDTPADLDAARALGLGPVSRRADARRPGPPERAGS